MATLIHQKFCPRCDRGFLGFTAALAMAKMMAHWRKAHPEHYAVNNDQT